MARRIGIALALCAVVVLLRVSLSAMSESRQGASFEEAGNVHEACVHYGRSIHMYLPLSPVPKRSGERLLALADAAEPRIARFCLEELRSGLLSIRSMWQPHPDLLQQAEDRMVPLMLADERGAWPDPALPGSEREAVVRAALAEREDPAVGWVLVMGLGWFVWLGGAAMGIVQGIPTTAAAPIKWGMVIRWGVISAVGYVLWLAGVAFA
ncbi:MAG: hypothetical protein GY898_12605 [Proteobacteria bacterium]|nr:hypothetical protein [Pseudomonadota bacterium]